MHLSSSGDSLGQQYTTPEEVGHHHHQVFCSQCVCLQVVGRRQCDIVIVGRGIHQAGDPSDVARKYKDAAYSAYIPRD